MNALGLFRKEWTESTRTYRILIVPLVFLLLGVAQPIVYHFMPAILDQAGMPEGMVIEMPPIHPPDVIASVFDQFNQIGVLIVVLVSMGVFSREIESGTAGFLSSLGFTRLAYFASKWSVLALIILASVVVGVVGAAYYTGILFTPLPWGNVIVAALIYFLHLAFVLALTLALNTLTLNQLASAAAALGISITLSLVGSVVPKLALWLPGYAAPMAKALLYGPADASLVRCLIPVAWTLAMCVVGYLGLRRRDL